MTQMYWCPFCKVAMRRFSSPEVQSCYQCDYHGSVRVRRFEYPNNHYTIALVVLYKEAKYHIQFFHGDDAPWKFRIDKINRRPHTDQIIMTMDFHPDITPENVESKLPTLILFS